MAQDAPPLITPNPNDVLLGKGNIINSHPGNRQFRLLADSQKQAFAGTNQKKKKRAIALQIFNEIEKLQPPGRFLVEDNSRNGSEKMFGIVDPDSNVHPMIMEKIWIVVKPEKALSKIMHRLREKGIEESALISPDQQLGTELSAEDTSLDQVRLLSASNANDGNSGMLQVRDTTKSSLAIKDVDLYVRPTSSQRDLRPGYLFDHTVATTNRNRVALEGNLDIDSCLSKCLEGYLDFESDAASAPQLDRIASHLLREYTLPQWVMSSKPQCSFNTSTSMQSSIKVNRKYVQSALLIALKLTECILEAENDELKGLKNPIPLASIAPENVLIRARLEGLTENSDEKEEVIEFAWVMSFVGDNSAIGDVMARLFAMGKVLFELFSTGKLAMEDNHTTSIISVNHNDKAESDYRLQKKSHWRSTKSDNKVDDWTASLDSNGVPWSLCALVKNLLECRLGSFCDDDAYASFADLKEDLQLMVDNPSCFLDNIRLTNKPRLEFPDKLYGRDIELLRLSELFYRHLTEKKIIGAIISGRAGVGKTVLAMHVQKLTYQSNGYFLSAKFEQNQMSLKPLAKISILFDSLCEKIFKDSSQSELKIIERDLTKAIGIQPTLLEVVPNLRNLMSSSVGLDSACRSTESTLSISYMLGELMRVLSSYSKPITLFIDDIQFADDASLQLVGNMILSTEGASTFFIFCHRDDEVSNGGSFDTWLALVSSLSLEVIQLKSITLEDVNNLISETLHLSRRKTRSLSSVLHCKTSGNPLFLRQLLDSLTEQGLIYVDMNQRRWAWDLDKITNLKISNSVLALLSKEIERLPNDLQLGLQVASCLGSCLAEPILSCLSKELGCDLKDILQQLCHKGVMLDINYYSSMFCFAHDKIQEAVYEMMDDQQRRKYHMRFGLALFNHTLNDCAENEEVFFAAVNQINRGGPGSVREPSQMNIIAELNLKAGRRAIELSDYNTAFELFQCGISYLGENKWKLNYQLSLELFDAASGAAFVLNNVAAVKFYSDEVISYARCFDDKLNCLCNASKALATYHPEEAMETSFGILLQFGELLPRTMGDCELTSDIENMSSIIRSMSDDMICSLHENNNLRRCTLFNLYEHMSHFLQYFKPWLFSSVSLRMIELTMKDGLSAKSPFAFANFGTVLISSGNVSDGYRLGKLALKMVDKKGSFQYKSSVISIVYDLIFWASEPLPSVIEALMQGHKDGQRSGDILIALKNMLVSILNCYAAGQSLDAVQKNILDFISKIHGLEIFLASPVLLLSQITILRDGLNAVHMANLPTEREILSDVRLGPSISTAGKIYHLTRAFLFRQLDVLLQIDISQEVTKNCLQLNTDILLGYFFEGLASFQLARSSFDESSNFVERGLSALEKMRGWSEHSVWNWESKMFLLEAENLYTEGIFFESAGLFYDRAIQSAHAHKFIHEEAIASELAGMFFHERGFHEKSYSYFAHSIKSYEKWGAHALAKRVKSDVIKKFGCDIQQLVSFSDVSLDSLFTTSLGSSNKHRLD